MIIDLQVVMFFHDAEIRTVFTFNDDGDVISGKGLDNVIFTILLKHNVRSSYEILYPECPCAETNTRVIDKFETKKKPSSPTIPSRTQLLELYPPFT